MKIVRGFSLPRLLALLWGIVIGPLMVLIVTIQWGIVYPHIIDDTAGMYISSVVYVAILYLLIKWHKKRHSN